MAGVPKNRGAEAVKIVFHADFRRAADVGEVELDVGTEVALHELLAMLAEHVPALAPELGEVLERRELGGNLLVLVGQQIATLDTVVRPGEKVRLTPPISGG